MFKTGDDIRSKAWAPVLDNGRHDRAQLGFILMSTGAPCARPMCFVTGVVDALLAVGAQ